MPTKLPTKQPKADTAPKKDTALEKALKDFNASWEYAKGSYHDRWINNYKLYHGERVKRGYDGITDTFVPMCFSTVETLRSALFGAMPKFNYLPPSNKPEQKTDVLNSWVNYCWERDQWSPKVSQTGLGMLREGNGINYYAWEGDHPVMHVVPLRDFIIDPTYTGQGEPRYAGRRFLTTIEQLKQFEVVDYDNPEMNEDGSYTYPMKPKYKNLDKLEKLSQSKAPGGKSGAGENTDKQEKDMFYGSTLGSDAEGQLEVIELWYEDKTISIANRSLDIEDTENYFKAKARDNGDEFPKGIIPFAWARDFTDESLFYAKGEIDFIADSQELLNDLTNQNIDAVTYTLNPMYTVDPKYADKIPQIENLPGAVFPFEAGTMQRVDMGSIPNDAFSERQNIKNEIRETTASNEVVKGAPNEGGKATATEVNAQIAGASSRIKLKIMQIENEYFYRMAKIVLALTRLYVTEPTLVRVVGKDGARWEEFDPEDWREGEYEPRVMLDIEIENQKAEAAGNAKEMYAAFMGDPEINQTELKKHVLAKGFQLDPDEVELLTTLDPMQAMGGMMPPPGEEQPPMPPADPGDPSDIPSDVALQLPPDATPDELEEIRAAMAAEQQGAPV